MTFNLRINFEKKQKVNDIIKNIIYCHTKMEEDKKKIYLESLKKKFSFLSKLELIKLNWKLNQILLQKNDIWKLENYPKIEKIKSNNTFQIITNKNFTLNKTEKNILSQIYQNIENNNEKKNNNIIEYKQNNNLNELTLFIENKEKNFYNNNNNNSNNNKNNDGVQKDNINKEEINEEIAHNEVDLSNYCNSISSSDFQGKFYDYQTLNEEIKKGTESLFNVEMNNDELINQENFQLEEEQNYSNYKKNYEMINKESNIEKKEKEKMNKKEKEQIKKENKEKNIEKVKELLTKENKEKNKEMEITNENIENPEKNNNNDIIKENDQPDYLQLLLANDPNVINLFSDNQSLNEKSENKSEKNLNEFNKETNLIQDLDNFNLERIENMTELDTFKKFVSNLKINKNDNNNKEENKNLNNNNNIDNNISIDDENKEKSEIINDKISENKSHQNIEKNTNKKNEKMLGKKMKKKNKINKINKDKKIGKNKEKNNLINNIKKKIYQDEENFNSIIKNDIIKIKSNKRKIG